MESINALRSDFPEVQITADMDLNSAEFRECVLAVPIVILRKFLKHPNCAGIYNSSPNESSSGANQTESCAQFSFESLERMHGEQKITVLAQNVDVSGFLLDQKNLWENMTLSSYMLYVKGLRHLLSAVESVCVKKWQSHLDAAIECMEGESEHERGITDCDEICLSGRNHGAFINKESISFDSEAGHSTKINVCKPHPTNAHESYSKAGESSLRSTHSKSHEVVGEEYGKAELMRLDYSESYGEERLICGTEKNEEDFGFAVENNGGDTICDLHSFNMSSSTNSDDKYMETIRCITAACTCTHHDSCLQQSSRLFKVRKQRHASRTQLQLLLSLLKNGIEDCENISTEIDESRRKKKKKLQGCPQQQSSNVHGDEVSSEMRTDIPKQGVSIVNSSYISWNGITTLDFKRINQDIAFRAMVGHSLVCALPPAPPAFAPAPAPPAFAAAAAALAPAAFAFAPAAAATAAAATAAAAAAAAAPAFAAPAFAAPAFAAAVATEEYNSINVLKNANGSETGHDTECGVADKLIKLLPRSEGMFNYWNEKEESPGSRQQRAAIKNIYESFEQTSRIEEFECEPVSGMILPEVSECDHCLPVDSTSDACPDLSDGDVLSCLQSDTVTSERDARNRAYITSCAQKRLSQHSSPFGSTAAIAIGCRKLLKRRNPFKFGILSPGSVRRRKKVFESVRNDNTSATESLASTNLMRKQQYEQKHLMESLRSVRSPNLTVSCIVRWGTSHVTVRFSVLEGVWSLDLTFHPYHVSSAHFSCSGENHRSSSHVNPFEKEMEMESRGRENSYPCVLYSPLDKCALLDVFTEHSFSSFAAPLSPRDKLLFSTDAPYDMAEADMKRILMLIVSTWPPLCSGRISNNLPNPSDIALNTIQICDGVAMQAELLRLMKCCPSGITTLLTRVLKVSEKRSYTLLQSNKIVDGDSSCRKCSSLKDCTRSCPGNGVEVEVEGECQPYVAFKGDSVDSETVISERECLRHRPFSATPSQSMCSSSSDVSSSSSHAEEGASTSVKCRDREELFYAPCAFTPDYTVANTPKPKKGSDAVSQMNIRAIVRDSSIFLSYEQLHSAKLEGLARGRVKFCTNLDMSKWSQEMQVCRDGDCFTTLCSPSIKLKSACLPACLTD